MPDDIDGLIQYAKEERTAAREALARLQDEYDAKDVSPGEQVAISDDMTFERSQIDLYTRRIRMLRDV